MNILKRLRLELCWRRGHRLFLGKVPSCATCSEHRRRQTGNEKA